MFSSLYHMLNQATNIFNIYILFSSSFIRKSIALYLLTLWERLNHCYLGIIAFFLIFKKYINLSQSIFSYGPREVLKKQDFSINGQLNCELKYAPYSCANVRWPPQGTADEAELASVICDALQPAICMVNIKLSHIFLRISLVA